MDARAHRRILPSVQALRTLEAVARRRSLTLAARELRLTAGAASRQLERLERKLGVPLIRVRSRPVALTKAGHAYLLPVQTFLKAVRVPGRDPAGNDFFPSMRAMLAFEAAADALSFQEAAANLFITASAVSQQVRYLERELECKIFLRLNNGLLLTDPGFRYLTQFQTALDALREATREIMEQTVVAKTLNICTLSTFAAEWLIPRLRSFSLQHPDIELCFLTGLGNVDFHKDDEIDVFISYGSGPWPGLMADRLATDPMVAIAAPMVTEGRQLTPTQLARLPLLHHTCMPHAWNEWLLSTGADAEQERTIKGYRFEQFSMLVQAAVAGLGIALVPRAFAARYLASGELQLATCSEPQQTYHYWLVYPSERLDQPAFIAFRNWLLSVEGAAPAAADA
ncbi:MAG: LysR substrate-binding domain-containing protein [Lautropia sp.]